MNIQRICLFLLFMSLATPVLAQTNGLPQGWEALSAPDFVQAMRTQKAQGNPVTPEMNQAISKHSVELLFATEQTLDQLDYTTLANLYRCGQSQLTANQAGCVKQKISNRADDLSAMDFQNLSGKFALQLLIGATIDQRAALVSEWIGAGHLEADHPAISPQDAVWLYRALAHPHMMDGPWFVVWSGNLRAPRSGDYIFSLSPLNVNTKWKAFFIQSDWTVTIDGAQVLRATPEHWTIESTPVSLKADQPVKFRAEAHFNTPRRIEDALHAILNWRGPGISTSIVPTENWTTPDGTGAGLAAEYHLTLETKNGAQTVSRVDPTIDFAWTSGQIVVPEHAKQRQQLVNYFLDTFMSAEFLASCADGQARHPFLYQSRALSECLTSSQRKSFLQAVLQRPTMLSPLTAQQVVALYKTFRFGAEQNACDALGLWCKSHSDLAAEFPKPATERGYFDANRSMFKELSRSVSEQYPNHGQRLQTEFLTNDGGTCCLPIAYTLAYAYQDQSRIDQWIKLLDDRLAEKSLSGNRRVNWLIARAMTEEIRYEKPPFFESGRFDLLAGEGWLNEAVQVGESADVVLRIRKERLARHVALQQWAIVDTELQQTAQAPPEWRQQIDAQKAGVTQRATTPSTKY